MTLFKDKYRVETTRLRGWDYAKPSWYFVTICTRNREPFFGKVIDGEMRLSRAGNIAADEWQKTQQIRLNVSLDEWIIMPNHIHGIIVITHGRRDAPAGRLYDHEIPVATEFPGVYHRAIQIGMHQTHLGQRLQGFCLATPLL